jgi:beta-barrel assembly-enhancing protease
MKLMTVVALLGSLTGTALAQQPSAKGVNFYSLEKERALGQTLAARLESVLPVVHEPKLDAYLAELGSALSKYADSPFPFTFTLYDDRKPILDPAMAAPVQRTAAMPMDALQGQAGEPVAVAGGTIFVPMSLLADSPSEAVFAFQLAHAMAHIAWRHSTRLLTRMDLMQIDTSAAQYTPGAGLAIPMGWLSFARAQEREADYRAVQILYKAGYDPEATAAYLSGKPAARQGSISKVFLPRPVPAERVKQIRAELQKLPAANYTAATGGFDDAKALAAGVVGKTPAPAAGHLPNLFAN